MSGSRRRRQTRSQTAQPDSQLLNAFSPVAHQDATILVLGSMPGVASLQAQQYYAHPRNAFWKILGSVFDAPADTWPQRVQLLHSNALALWDVLSQCQRAGSLDASIREDSIVCNDFAGFLRSHAAIRRIVFNGKTAQRLFQRYVLPTLTEHDPAQTHREMLTMPSTSPAMASLTLAQKTQAWRPALVLPVCPR